jgi:N-methylhydantoinase B
MSTIPGAEKYRANGDLDEQKLTSHVDLHSVDEVDIDPVTHEILQHKFTQLVEEMGSTIKNVSGSVAVTDALDFQTSLGTELGDLISIGPYISTFTSVTDLTVKWVLQHRAENPGIEQGDMFLCNDPWIGPLHQNDVALMKPVFWHGQLFCWVTSVVHQQDVGGVDAGSFVASAQDVFDEGTPLPPIKIVENGEIRDDVEDIYLRHSRTPPMLGMDLRSKIAANNIARDRIHELIQEFGAETVKMSMENTLDQTEERFKQKLADLPDGTWKDENYIESAKVGDNDLYKFQLEMQKQGKELTFRLSGDAQQGGINCTYAGFVGGILPALLPMLAHDMSWATSAFKRVVDFNAESGTVANAEYPAGVSMSSVMANLAVIDSSSMLISKMLSASEEYKKDLMVGASGAWPIVSVAGLDSEGDPFGDLFTDCMAAGWGARSYKDGIDTGGHMAPIRGQIPSVERAEEAMPVLYLYRREEPDSAGAGKYRGGVGASIGWKPHDAGGPEGDNVPLELTLASFGVAFPGIQGICGGRPPASNLYKVARGTDIEQRLKDNNLPEDIESLGETELLAPKETTHQAGGDVFHVRWGGAPGYGDPLERDPELVRDDVEKGYVSPEAAKSEYGVVVEVSDNQASIDREATETNRSERLSQRLDRNDAGGEN